MLQPYMAARTFQIALACSVQAVAILTALVYAGLLGLGSSESSTAKAQSCAGKGERQEQEAEV